MNDIDQTTVNLLFIKAQSRRLTKIEEENKMLREIVEAMRVHLLDLKQKLLTSSDK